MRALGVNLPGLSRKTLDRRPYPPGQHGGGRQKRKSDYARQLIEKQKLRLNYGVTERVFRRYMVQARASKMPTGDKLCELLERRMDNVVFRAGFAPTIPAARQLIGHRHMLLNGKRADIPSIRVKVGDVITIREKSKQIQVVIDSLAGLQLTRPDWIEYNGAETKVTIVGMPTIDSVPLATDVQQVVEYYSKRL
jgi:small subunit ribosomal protein S4